MNRIIYFSIAQDNESFKNNLSKWKVAPNTSNQNFHNKLIRSLAIDENVEVISIRPINDNYLDNELKAETKIEGNVIWNYIGEKKSKISRYLTTYNKIERALTNKFDKDTIVFTDTLNAFVLNNAYKFARRHNLKIIGICTDSPLNISFISDRYKANLIKMGQQLDGYIALTPKINDLYNIHNKPFLIIEGITENCKKAERIIDDEYIFFGGSLMKEYGIYNLIDAFNGLENKDIKLVICGHHEPETFANYIKDNERIIYLGVKAYEDILGLEQHALIAVNPRPLNPQIDEYSIPSKTLEYMASGALTITVDNELLKKHYKEGIIWAKDGSVEAIKEALEYSLNLSEIDRQEIINKAKKEIQRRTSSENINREIKTLFF